MLNTSPFATGPGRAAGQFYRQVAVDSQVGTRSDAHHLVSLLFDGLFEAIAQARGALRAGDVPAKCKALTRAAAIVEEGLRAALDLRAGGQLARDLQELYGYVTMRLTQANLSCDEAPLDECVRLMRPLADAWVSIRTQASNT